MDMEINGCGECPFKEDPDEDYNIERPYCKHPKRYLIDLYETDEGIITPSDCPLLKESLTIKLKP